MYFFSFFLLTFQELRKKTCVKITKIESYGPLNLNLHSATTEIKPIFFINNNVIITGTKGKKTKKNLNGNCLKKVQLFAQFFSKFLISLK